MSEDAESKLIKNRFDLKCATYYSLDAAINLFKSGEVENISLGKNAKVSIFTSFGIVEGDTILDDSMETDKNSNDLAKVFSHTLLNKIFEVRNNDLKELESKNANLKLTNGSSAILLENAVIIPYSNPSCKHNVGYFIIFGDEIKGLSFGEVHQ